MGKFWRGVGKVLEHSLAERDKMLQEAHGPGYMPESSLATAGAVALVAAAKELYQDSVHLANTATAIYMNNYAVIYSANDKQRSEALNKNLELFENAEKALYAVISNPGIISGHYHNKAQDASNAFAIAYNSGNLVAAGNAAGKVVYDIYTASTAATTATAATTKAVTSAAKLTNNFVATHKFKPPVTFKFNPGRLNSGIPVDDVKLQNPIEPKASAKQTPTSLGHSRAKLKQYLNKINDISREQLINDLNSIGFKYTGGSGDGKYCNFENPERGVRVRIDDAHPPKRGNGCKYQHIHLFDKNGNSLSADLKIVPPSSPEAHIKISDKISEQIIELIKLLGSKP